MSSASGCTFMVLQKTRPLWERPKLCHGDMFWLYVVLSNTYGFESFLECVAAFSATTAATTTWWQSLVEKRSVAAELALISLESLWTVQMTLDPVPTRKDHQLHWNRLCHHLSGLLVSLLFACCGEISRVLWVSKKPHGHLLLLWPAGGHGLFSGWDWSCLWIWLVLREMFMYIK